MNPLNEYQRHLTRRHLLGMAGYGIGAAALMQLDNESLAGTATKADLPPGCHHQPKAKTIIHLMMSGAPSQIETFDYKPGLGKLNGTPIPDSVRMGQRVTGMTKNQKQLVHGSLHQFKRYRASPA